MTEEYIVRAPALRPFVELPHLRCDACGNCTTWWDRVVARLTLKWPCALNVTFCPGSKEPTEITVAPGPAGAVFGISAERTNSCAGIFEPHLHMRCHRCGWATMMRTQQKG